MSVTLQQQSLSLSESIDTITYDFGMVQQIISPEETTKNKITATIEKTFVKKDHLGYLYNIKINNRSQSNIDDMFGLEEALAFLYKNITLYTNDYGEIITILNRGQIAEEWYDLAKRIKKKFKHLIPDIKKFLLGIDTLIEDNESFVSMIKKSEIYSALFSPIYNQNIMEEITIEQQKDFDNFFDLEKLPLRIETTITGINKDTKGKQFMRSGAIDYARFDKESASELFIRSYGVHEYALNFNASYLEVLDLDQNNQVDKATIMLGVKVNDLYQLKQISKLMKKK
ncbi:hypothetical protein [Aquimarina sp. 2201CG14-23]|uniref:hypothetical protein n=1 Tax=Aquimarina mycalae TaxID=3040073 RepID=UPI00247815B5|nr:hypothetical protein [Aquimarina sp. 2201CG14-23]MDH7448221.1 hypothetical protein [Aquimarina sp. 2201CG14-23]